MNDIQNEIKYPKKLIQIGKIHVSGVSCLLSQPDWNKPQTCCKPSTLAGVGGHSCFTGDCPIWPSRTGDAGLPVHTDAPYVAPVTTTT